VGISLEVANRGGASEQLVLGASLAASKPSVLEDGVEAVHVDGAGAHGLELLGNELAGQALVAHVLGQSAVNIAGGQRSASARARARLAAVAARLHRGLVVDLDATRHVRGRGVNLGIQSVKEASGTKTRESLEQRHVEAAEALDQHEPTTGGHEGNSNKG
jgi:hypothetical protein